MVLVWPDAPRRSYDAERRATLCDAEASGHTVLSSVSSSWAFSISYSDGNSLQLFLFCCARLLKLSQLGCVRLRHSPRRNSGKLRVSVKPLVGRIELG